MGSRYGQIGGRSLEMMTADVDNNQVKRVFGIDYDHMEQWDLIHKAMDVPDDDHAPMVGDRLLLPRSGRHPGTGRVRGRTRLAADRVHRSSAGAAE